MDKLLQALRDIAEHTNPEPPLDDRGYGNYRSDDREGCFDTVFAIATKAVAEAQSFPPGWDAERIRKLIDRYEQEAPAEYSVRHWCADLSVAGHLREFRGANAFQEASDYIAEIKKKDQWKVIMVCRPNGDGVYVREETLMRDVE